MISFGIAFLFAAVSLFLTHEKALACTCVVVGKNASATGKVLVGHNEDDSGRCVMAHHLVPQAERPDGTTISFERCSPSLDRSGKTFGYIWAQARSTPALSGADCFLNDRGVFVASDSCRHSRLDNEPELLGGGLVYGLRISIAERARSARHGVEIATGLLDRYGYGDSGRCYIIADSEEAWMLQVMKGKLYCAKKVDDDEVAFIPNHYTIRDVSPGDPGIIMSPGLAKTAVEKGWLAGKEERFDFALTVQDPDSLGLAGNMYRHRHALSRITGTDWSEEKNLPFSVKPGRPMEVKDVMEILRDHYEGSRDDVRGETDRSPHHTEVRRICTGTTLGSLLVRFRERPELDTLWTTNGRPCTSPFVPWYGGILGLPEEFVVEEHEKSLERHFDFKPEDMAYDPANPWWTVQKFQSILDGQFDGKFEFVKNHIQEVEKNWLEEDDSIVERASEMMKEDRDEGLLLLTRETAKKARQAVDMIRYMSEKLPVKAVSTSSEWVTKDSRKEEITLSFESDVPPKEDSLIFGQGMQSPNSWATAIKKSLRKEGDRWEVTFRVRELTEKCTPCKSDFWLYGDDESGASIVGRATLDVRDSK